MRRVGFASFALLPPSRARAPLPLWWEGELWFGRGALRNAREAEIRTYGSSVCFLYTKLMYRCICIRSVVFRSSTANTPSPPVKINLKHVQGSRLILKSDVRYRRRLAMNGLRTRTGQRCEEWASLALRCCPPPGPELPFHFGGEGSSGSGGGLCAMLEEPKFVPMARPYASHLPNVFISPFR